MYEHYRQPLLPAKAFYRRMLQSLGYSLLILVATVFVGGMFFTLIEKAGWLDSLLNSVLIMTGVGTTVTPASRAGKIFTGLYSIASTLVFFTVLAIIFAPLLHRLLHKLHLDLGKES